ncbi:glucose-6-phosphate 1-epimerase [Chytriomyces confervae]|uniref:Glucose-6-phosphate 1-epimerase n=1 Tax=Chytriomyces confervae TaxID=246404 RepID=A0A507FME2_9FUNG|nr:hypothetical protein HDU80_009276 [Chytriomyces hyalinus]TPX77591.1 glucose-6-phosphate 1-epimerase [Chytriomyces confervae]
MPVTLQDDKVIASIGQATVEIYHYGATVTSWKCGGKERLYLSSQSFLDGSKAIRGGIPLVFPHFGSIPESQLPQHGFARVSRWSWLGVQSENASEIVVAFGLDRSGVPEKLAALWTHGFKLVYTVTLTADTLKTALSAENTGPTAFTFTSLLHTYFAINDIDHVNVTGLKGKQYNEKIYNKYGVTDESEVISVTAELDRNYFNVPSEGITVVENNAVVRSLSTKGFDDVVVWNPWIEKAKSLADFPDEGYKNMICVEVGQIGKPITLNPGEKWTGEQLIR